MLDFDPAGTAGPVPSPCTNVCQMDPATGWCRGCLRTIEEIAQWGGASEAARRAVWVSIVQRQNLFKPLTDR